ncbi:SPOR domain-containing protein [Dokdonella sp.]|uniref:SPOR domain-containing protein n=1 Tax=Dokdonella sp. TaxID=2291710 RepID=UPI0031C89E11|nr:SPOR domain-containing protein [Dokdonella sp.]
MDSSLKQRLLGAAVLIALAVIFVPMFLAPSAPRDSTELQSSTIAIPPQPEAEFQTRVLPTTPEALPTPSAPGPDQLASIDTATAPKPEDATPLADAGTAPAAAPGPTPAAGPATLPAPVTATPGEPAATPGKAALGQWFVHLGVYGAAGNASDLVAALRKDGYPAFDEATTWQGKAARRVRVGPYANRAAAEAARLKIKQARPQVPGSVVEVAADAQADAPANALPANRAGGWVVQVGALKAEADANKLRDRLKGAGFVAFVDKVDADGTTLWRVRAGPEVDRGAADRLRASIKDKLKLDGIVVVL